MAEFVVVGDELKKMVKLGKKQPMPFAYCPSGGENDGPLFATHRTKSSDIIAKATRKDSGQGKVAFGSFVLDGKLMILTCEKELPSIAKKLKKHLRDNKVQVNIKLLDASGNELESDIEDLVDDGDDDDDAVAPAMETADESSAEPAPVAPPAAPAGDASALAQRLRAIQPGIMAAPGDGGDRLRAALAAAVGLIKAGDLARADTTITAIEAAYARHGKSASDAAVAPAAAAAPPPPPPPPPAPNAEAMALMQRLVGLRGRIEALEGPSRDKLMAALALAGQQIKGGDLVKSEQSLDMITKALGQVQAAAAAPAQDAESDEADEEPPLTPEQQALAAKWAAVIAKIEPASLDAIKAGKGNVDAIRLKLFTMQDLAADNKFAEALAMVRAQMELIRAAQSATKTQAELEIPADVVPFVQSRHAWIATRATLQSEIGRLKSAIDDKLSSIEGLEDAVSETNKLFTYLNALDTRLENTLETLVTTPDGPERQKLKDAARGIIAAYSGELDSDFFKDVDDNNGFVKVTVRSAALESLKGVSAALT